MLNADWRTPAELKALIWGEPEEDYGYRDFADAKFYVPDNAAEDYGQRLRVREGWSLLPSAASSKTLTTCGASAFGFRTLTPPTTSRS
jgi:hypothetical protein